MRSLIGRILICQTLYTLLLYFFIVHPPLNISKRIWLRSLPDKVKKVQQFVQSRRLFRPGFQNMPPSALSQFDQLFLITDSEEAMTDLLNRDTAEKLALTAGVRKILEKNKDKLEKRKEFFDFDKSGTDVRLHYFRMFGKDRNIFYYNTVIPQGELDLIKPYFTYVFLIYFMLSAVTLVLLISMETEKGIERRHEKELEYNERIKEWQLLSAGVAHEIKNPLSSISMFAELLSRKVENREPEAEYLGYIFKEVKRLNAIVSNFLSFSRPPQLTPEKQDLNRLLREAVAEFGKSYEKIEFNFQASAIDEFYFDPAKIKQVILNVIKNSVEAIMEKSIDGKILIRTEVAGKQVKVVFEDSGPGIRESQDRVLQPFFTTKSQGSGLGLSISYQIMKSHLGDLAISNLENNGCRVELTLPYQRFV
ncbi:MAG: histidine kinase dimerization/phospho-acceptor domain-containing protein [Candidatus Wallbacteria bacterium]|nr:histidine kinase dimerization/phospho-acceptor domain-containing protein [Candidatus Wallbacteria bacterium]